MKSLEKTHEKAFIQSFLGACFVRALTYAPDHVSMVQMIVPRSTVDRSFRTPPTVLPLMGGGGGPESLIRPACIWTAQDRACRSTINIGFRTPPSVLPLMEGGGGPECVIKVCKDLRLRNRRSDQWLKMFFGPPRLICF
jgi:hypothetical protein